MPSLEIAGQGMEFPWSRRQWLARTGGGLGTLALAGMLADQSTGTAAEDAATGVERQLSKLGTPHFVPRAKRVIHLFMNGGPFQADFFDPKPLLNKYAGQRPREVDFRTENATGGLMAVPTGFRPGGTSGLSISELLPELGSCADELCVLRSLHCDNPNHGPALLQMSNGTITPTRPSYG